MRIPSLLVVALVAGCQAAPAEIASGAVGSNDLLDLNLDACSRLPAGFQAASARTWDEGSGKLVLSPAQPAPDQPVVLLVKSLFPRYYGAQSALLHYTTTGWGTVTDVELADVCPESMWPIYGLSLAGQPDGTTLKLAVRMTHPPDFQVRESWMNNRGSDYAVEFQRRGAWLGGTELRVAVGQPRSGPAFREIGYPLDADLVAAGMDVSVATRTYPMGAVSAVTLHWQVEGGAAGEGPMTVARNGAGPYGNDAEWIGAVPASLVTAGAKIRTWVTAVDGAGATLEETQDGARRVLTIQPRRFEVRWGGKFGAWRPSSRSFSAGGLFHADGSELETTFGCNNHGASLSSYEERAARIWIPGLSDHAFANEDAVRAYSTLVRVETLLDDGRTMGGRVQGKVENDFVVGFLPFVDLCLPDGSVGLPEGDHQVRVRASVDGGATWTTFGDGDDGQGALVLHFRKSCNYFDSPGDC